MKTARELAARALAAASLGTYPRAIVRGGPGTGKTTASVALFLELARTSLRTEGTPSRRGDEEYCSATAALTLPPHRILHISGSWTRARAVQAALDLSPEMGLDAREETTVHTMTSFCAAQIDSSLSTAAVSTWGKGDQIVRSQARLEKLLASRLDEVFPPWVIEQDGAATSLPLLAPSLAPDTSSPSHLHSSANALVPSPFRPMAAPARNIYALLSLHQRLCWEGQMAARPWPDGSGGSRHSGDSEIGLSDAVWEALWALEDVMRDEGVVPAHALANELLRALDEEEAVKNDLDCSRESSGSCLGTTSTNTRSCRLNSGLAARVRRDYGAVIVDDAQDLTPAEIEVLFRLFVEREEGRGGAFGDGHDRDARLVCFFEDPSQRVFGHRGASPEGIGPFAQKGGVAMQDWDFLLANRDGRPQVGDDGRIEGERSLPVLHRTAGAPHVLSSQASPEDGAVAPSASSSPYPPNLEWAHVATSAEEMDLLSSVVQREIVWQQGRQRQSQQWQQQQQQQQQQRRRESQQQQQSQSQSQQSQSQQQSQLDQHLHHHNHKIAVVARTAAQARIAAARLERAVTPDAVVVRVGTAREESLWSASQQVRAVLGLLEVAVRCGGAGSTEGEDTSQRLAAWLAETNELRYGFPSGTLKSLSDGARYTGLPLWTALRRKARGEARLGRRGQPGDGGGIERGDNQTGRAAVALLCDVERVRAAVLGGGAAEAEEPGEKTRKRRKSSSPSVAGKGVQNAVREIILMRASSELQRERAASDEAAYLEALFRVVERVEESELRRRRRRREAAAARRRDASRIVDVGATATRATADPEDLRDAYTEASACVVLDALEEAVLHPGSLTSTGKSISATKAASLHQAPRGGAGSWMDTLAEELEVEWELEWQSATEAGARLLAGWADEETGLRAARGGDGDKGGVDGGDDGRVDGGDGGGAEASSGSGSSTMGSGVVRNFSPLPTHHQPQKKQVHVMTMHALRDASVEHFESVVLVGCTDASLPGRQRSRTGTGVGLVLPDGATAAALAATGKNGKPLSKTARERAEREWRRQAHIEEERRLLHASVARSRGRVVVLSSEREGGGMEGTLEERKKKKKKKRAPSRFLKEMTEGDPAASVGAWWVERQKQEDEASELEDEASELEDEASEMSSAFSASAFSASDQHQIPAPATDTLSVHDERAPLRLSFSSMSDYDMCPHRYYLKEVLGFPRARSSPIMVYGTVLHAGVQEYWERRMHMQGSNPPSSTDSSVAEPDPDVDRLPRPTDLAEYVGGLWFDDASPLFCEEGSDTAGTRTATRDGIQSDGGGASQVDWTGGTTRLATFSPPSAHSVLGKRAQDGMRAFVEWANADAVAGGLAAMPPSAVELKLSMDLGAWAAREGHARARELEGVTLVGVVDAAWGLYEEEKRRGGGGGFAIAEYKSNAFGAEGRQKIKQMARSSLQPRLYAMLINEELRRRRQRKRGGEEDGGGGSSRQPVVMVQGIEQRAAVGEAPLDEDAMEEAVGAAADMARGVRNGEFLAKPGRFACGWCGWRSVCKHAMQ